MKTRAAILVKQGAPLVLDELELPPLDFGQVQVQVQHSGVCGSQLGEIDGRKGPDRWLPHLLGHEATGAVEAVGPAVTKVQAGQQVVLHWRPGTGIQAATPKYRWGQRTVNAGWVTTFQERTVVSENRVTPIPPDLAPETAVLMGCALTTGFGVASRDARIRPGESVVVFGAGGVGLCVVLAAHTAGAHPVVAVDVQPHKLELAERCGATHTVLSQPGEDVSAAVAAALGEPHSDVVIETSGRTDVMELAYRLASAQGRTVLVGVPQHEERLAIPALPLYFGKTLTGSHGGDTDPTYDIPRLIRLLAARQLDLAPLISHRFELAQVNEAIEAMRQGQAIRCLLSMTS